MAEHMNAPVNSPSAPAVAAKNGWNLTRIDWALIAAVIVAVILARIIPGARTIDDAYITFRYSRNIVEGIGFVYNPGAHVLGTTTPLYTLLMSLIAWLLHGDAYPNYALVVNTLADIGTAIMLGYLVRRVTGNRWLGSLLGFLWAICPASVTFAIGGMETSLVIFWMVGAVVLFVADNNVESKNHRWTAIAFGVCLTFGFLTRIDSALWIGPLLAYQLIERFFKRQPPPWTTWISAGVTLLPWLIFSVAYFGSPVANTISAKSVAYLFQPGAAAIQLFRLMATPFNEPGVLGAIGSEIAFILYVPLVIIGMIAIVRKMPRLIPWLLYPWLYALVFSIANPLMFRWYFLPPMPALFFILLCGLWAIIDSAQQAVKRARHRPQIPRSALVIGTIGLSVVGLLWVVASFSAWTLHPDDGQDQPAPQMAWTKFELNYEDIAIRLRTKYGVTADTLVASADIGTVGYFSRAIILDTVGLVTPAISHYYPIDESMVAPGENYAVPPRLILDAKPMYFVTMEGYIHSSLSLDPIFQAEYKLVDIIPMDYFGTGMQLYQRQSAP
jgi:hypothetical protein